MKFITEKIKSIQSELKFQNQWIYELEQKVKVIERSLATPIPDEQDIERAFDVIFSGLHIAKSELYTGAGSTPSIHIQLTGDLKRLNDFVRYMLKTSEE